VIAARSGLPVVADFRSADAAVGGEGAPLTPYVDFLLFARDDAARATLNLGGIANLCLLPAGSDPGAVLAFDAGPANMVIDGVVGALSGGLERCDANGARAAAGRAADAILFALMDDPYFRRPPPKSTGRERFGGAAARSLIDRGRAAGLGDDDLVATATEWAAEAVARAFTDFIAPRAHVREVIVSGGGVNNPVLMRALRDRMPQVDLVPSDALGYPGEAREAVAFAVLASEAVAGRAANLPGGTGARAAAVLGSFTPGPRGVSAGW
jgi:anhydro-N-acetylmuramic acid kinase